VGAGGGGPPTAPGAGGYPRPELAGRLPSNESPDPPLPEVVEAITRALARANRYPDPSAWDLRRALSDRYEVPANHIAIGNGSCGIPLAAGGGLPPPWAQGVCPAPSLRLLPP